MKKVHNYILLHSLITLLCAFTLARNSLSLGNVYLSLIYSFLCGHEDILRRILGYFDSQVHIKINETVLFRYLAILMVLNAVIWYFAFFSKRGMYYLIGNIITTFSLWLPPFLSIFGIVTSYCGP